MSFNLSQRGSPGLFFGLTLGLSWSCWILAVFLGRIGPGAPLRAFHYFGGLMPAVVALALLRRMAPADQADYWRRLFTFRQIRPLWYAVIVLIPVFVIGFAAFADVLLGGQGARLEAAATFRRQPLLLFPFTISILAFGPIPEEMGWRGFVLDSLQARFTALNSSLILGVVWTLWHLPLFWIPGTYQQQLGVGTAGFWYFMADKIPQSILMTWIYNSTRRSTLSAVLFHFMVNYLGELFAPTLRAEGFSIVLWILAALVVTLAVGRLGDLGEANRKCRSGSN